MSAIVWGRVSGRPIFEEERVPFAKTAPHIRGRVFKRGPTWHYEVINTHTGRVVASDDTNHRIKILDECHAATAAARGAWTHGYSRKDLK